MGSNNSKEQFQTIDRGTLNEYRELTPFSKAEILSFHSDFHKLNPNKPRRPDPRFKASAEQVAKLPILTCNPFKDQIIKVFSDRDSMVSMDDFLDMMIVFHPKTTKTIKAVHMFIIYDFNRDGFLCLSDIQEVIKRITGNKLSEQDLVDAAKKVMDELDLDKSNKISLEEFEFFVSKCPDFCLLFSSTQNTS